MPFKFEKLEVWALALDYIDQIYEIANELPRSEAYNLRSQMTRAATSVALNIAEGSTGPQLDTLISHRFPMSQVQDALALSATHETGKILLDPWA